MLPHFDPALIPDPFKPLLPTHGVMPLPSSRHRQRQRRATILATTRRLLARGQDQFTLRRISEECGVTVQTIRNGFGRRDDLLVSAINEHTSAIWHALERFSAGPALFLDLAQMYYHCARNTPEFLRAMVTTAIASAQPLADLQRHGVTIKVEHLRAMCRAGDLAPGTDITALAGQITRLNTFMMYEWAMAGDAEELRCQMIAGNKMLLAGAIAPIAATRLDEWLPFTDH